MKNSILAGTLLSALAFTSCTDDDNNNTPTVLPETTFTVTIENAFQAKDFFAQGATDGLITPGNSQDFSFNAGKGHYLSFATMFVQSNDLFYAPMEGGIALYDDDGNALTGDITSHFYLWDAGTEVNEEPGVGTNQAPRQSGPDTGTAENGVVKLISEVNDGYTYPAKDDVINVSIKHDGGTMFTVTVSNVSANASVPTPFAPGNWVVHSKGQYPLFQKDQAASEGLEDLAEDGGTDVLSTAFASMTGLVSPFAPGAYSVGNANTIFTLGAAPTSEFEMLTEDGNPSGFTNHFNTPEGASAPAPIFPGEKYSFTFTAMDGDMLSMATMLVQSNDWVLGFDNIKLFNNGSPISGDISNQLILIDGGSEVDEYAGAGPYQAPRQPGPNSGMTEDGTIEVEGSPSSNLLANSEMLRVTITSSQQ
ncbi:spondin domain-containing protein [Flammeovirga sp. EKP202]|uniref:spondin domain-containing protein n=1 Tax=Flammeovirga sp. EKP202 TaxID=2770592 RepID=UPI00165F46C4|nr:spondin domain-containing protein [Flammeovirga sp. EKP202]MBD0403178.1 spondin domain-containing protein [Flammeovirga sp. EKP202]